VDQDPARVALLQAGGIPIYEPGLDELVQRNLLTGRLHFTTSMAQALPEAEVVFIAVGTPALEDGGADLQHVLAVARHIGEHLVDFKVIVNKSTVPVGTAQAVQAKIRAELLARGQGAVSFAVVSNPEFLKEGAAIDDFMRPDRIVIGVPSSAEGERARTTLTRLYQAFNRHHDRTVWMDVVSAELTKYAANAMLATRISFMNDIAQLADSVGADVDSVRRGMGSDTRIGHSFLYAGAGYGGSCFPKDTRALVRCAQDHGLNMPVVFATEQVNARQKQRLLAMVTAAFGHNLSGVKLAIWGLAFKPNTNDMREAPSLEVLCALHARGASLVAYDPVAMREAHTALAHLPCEGDSRAWLQAADTPMNALNGADALLLLTEWKCFHNPDFDDMGQRMRERLILDGRNLYDPHLLQTLGFAYHGVGRRNALGQQRLAVPRPRPHAAGPMSMPAMPSIAPSWAVAP
jgi:UDPglucose 6-dehydrogenase